MERRGCAYIKKARVAQLLGAQAVLVRNDEVYNKRRPYLFFLNKIHSFDVETVEVLSITKRYTDDVCYRLPMERVSRCWMISGQAKKKK